MVYLVYGNEPWAIRRQKEIFKKQCPEMEYGYQEFEDEYAAKDFLLSFSFLAVSGKYAFLRIEGLQVITKKDYSQFLSEMKENKENHMLIQIDSALDKENEKKKIKALGGCVTQVFCFFKLKNDASFWQQLGQIVQTQQTDITKEALKEMVDRLDYFGSSETNLITIENYISQLKYVGSPVDKEDVIRNVPDLRESNHFQLTGLIVKKNTKRVIEEMEKLKREKDFSPLMIFGLFFKEFRSAYLEKTGFSMAEQGLRYSQAGDLEISELVECMNIISDRMRDVKTGIYTDREAFDLCVTQLLCVDETEEGGFYNV